MELLQNSIRHSNLILSSQLLFLTSSFNQFKPERVAMSFLVICNLNLSTNTSDGLPPRNQLLIFLSISSVISVNKIVTGLTLKY